MSWPDIDITVVGKPNINNCLKTVDYLFHKEGVYSLSLQDFRKSIYPDRPQGIYCGVVYLIKPKTFYKIDIWFLSNTKSLKESDWVREKITTEKRLIILKIKNEIRKTKYGKNISGMEVCRAVLEREVKNLKEFKKYLKTSLGHSMSK